MPCLCQLLPSHYPVQLLNRCCVWQETFGTLKDWVRELKMQGPSNILIAVVGQSVSRYAFALPPEWFLYDSFRSLSALETHLASTFINLVLTRPLCPHLSTIIRSNMLHPFLNQTLAKPHDLSAIADLSVCSPREQIRSGRSASSRRECRQRVCQRNQWNFLRNECERHYWWYQ